ncbi:MAG: outer membrane beta-barrel protein [Gemmatimonadales bacterium]
MLRASLRAGFTIVVAGLCLASPLAAQKLFLSPTIGVYIPTTELVKAAQGQEFKQEVALAVGGRLGLRFGERLGLVTSVSYVPSNLRFTFNNSETKTDANLLFGSARASFQVIPWTSPVWLGLNAGASLVKRSGDAYANLEDKTDVGGVVGATVGFNLGSFLSLYVAADDYIYGTTFVDENTLEEKQTQNDVHLSLGFGLPLNK